MNKEPKILLWDIECTHLKADFGTCLCIGYKWLGQKKVHVPSIMDYKGWQKDTTNDKKLLQEFYKVASEADMWVTYYGKGFDVPYIQAKLLEHGLPYLPPVPHVDLYFTVKSNLALSRKSLANVSTFLQLDAKKTPVAGTVWKRATTGHGPSIRYVIDHCKADVNLLEEAYYKLRPLVRTHPRVNGYGPCNVCGSEKVQSRGYMINTLRNKKRKMQCQDCGNWFSLSLSGR